MSQDLSKFIKEKRKDLRLTQVELSEKAGVGIRFIRELEGVKKTLRIDKINQVQKSPIEIMEMMKKAKVFMHNDWAGTLIEDTEGYHYIYEDSYLKKKDPEPISLTLSISPDKYTGKVQFPFAPPAEALLHPS
jgi:transcriptional regulator with XRE-family HTH domain